MSDDDVVLRMRGVHKAFGGTPALISGDLEVRRGEVHALMGQNGAGKSTLIKVLTGVYSSDGGEMTFRGEPIAFRSPHEAQSRGISPIYQEINLVPQRTVAENIVLGREPRRWGLVDRRRMEQESRELLRRVGVDVDVSLPLENLSTANQQMVAIARALSFDAQLIIMDEPTSSLHDREVDTLFAVIDQLKRSGVAVIFVSHKLDELYRICDRITILRDGRTVLTTRLDELSRLDLVATMLGRKPEAVAVGGQTSFARPANKTHGGTLLKVQHASVTPRLRDASFSVREGEIVGIAGLLGSGRTELASALYGSAAMDGGRAELDGRPFAPRSPGAAISDGVAMTPEDRKTEGLVGVMSIAENVSLSLLPRISRLGFVDRRREQRIVQTYMDRLRVKSTGPHQLVAELSGGNQQKVLLARALALDPRLLILDEPTRGVDVGAKREIQQLISDIADVDRGVILISSEMEEVVEGSDRIVVLRDGETIASLEARTVTNAQIMIYMASGSGDAAGSEDR